MDRGPGTLRLLCATHATAAAETACSQQSGTCCHTGKDQRPGTQDPGSKTFQENHPAGCTHTCDGAAATCQTTQSITADSTRSSGIRPAIQRPERDRKST